MKRLSKIRSFPGAQSLCALRDGFLVKEEDLLALYDRRKKVQDLLKTDMYARKVLLSPREDTIFLPNGLLSGKGLFLSLEAPNPVRPFSFERGLLLDACYSLDGTFYYLKREEERTVLCRLRQGAEETLLVDGHEDDRIGFFRQWNALLLFDRRGHFAFVGEGRILFDFFLEGSRKVYPFRKGNLLLSDSPRGFLLLSGRGKILKRMDFLLPWSKDERILDFVFLEEKETILCLTRKGRKTNLYVFDSVDFSLVDVALDMKKEADALITEGNVVGLKSRFGIDLFDVVLKAD